MKKFTGLFLKYAFAALVVLVLAWMWTKGFTVHVASPTKAPVLMDTKPYYIYGNPAVLSWVDCFTMDTLRVEGQMYHARMHNQCAAPTRSFNVKIAFYDADGFRHGFTEFEVLPMAPDEHVRYDGPCPRLWCWCARVFSVDEVRQPLEFKGGMFNK